MGVTRFCLHPDHLRREKTRVGGTKGVKVDVILDLQPDLVIANLEENDAQDIMALEIAGVPCWVCDVRTVERAFRLVADLGALVGAGGTGPCPGSRGRVRVGGGSSGRPGARVKSSGLCGLAQPMDVGRARCLHPERAALVGLVDVAR